jgi:hypothetical protein
MAPTEDLQARDLEWISDFAMQQMVIMLRPMMEHLQQTDSAVDCAQHAVQRLNMDISEVRTDLERTNKYLAILRQGLGVQNEGRCVLQGAIENNTRVTKRLDEQMEVCQREVRELRRQQLHQINVVSKFSEDKAAACTSVPPSAQSCRAALGAVESSWPQKKGFTPLDVGGVSAKDSSAGGSSQQSKRMGRVSSGASAKPSSLLSQEHHLEFSGAPATRGNSRAGIWGGVGESSCSASSEIITGDDAGPFAGAHPLGSDRYNDRYGSDRYGSGADEPAASSRLPLLAAAARGPAAATAIARPPDNGYSESRWRFSATMHDRSTGPSSRGGT